MDLIKQYSNEKIATFFNGGKDSLVLLDLVSHVIPLTNIPIVYIVKENEFEEMEKYVKYIATLYKINIIYELDMKQSIRNLIKNYGISHAFTGIRNIDPYGKTHVQKTDPGWPEIFLINPLLEWSYHDIWTYIKKNNLEYCCLYDQGYTSLGQKDNTFKNYSLYDVSLNKFLPAYNLQDGRDERLGRIKGSLPLTLEGIVIHGNKMGRQLGFKTANINISYDIGLDDGVYYGNLTFKGENKKFVMSYGQNIHFDAKKSTLEIHIIDLDVEDFYGMSICFTISGFIRRMCKFDSIDELVKSINKDILIAKIYL